MKKKIALTVMGVVFLSTAAMAQKNDNVDGNCPGYNGSGYHMGYQNNLNLTDEQYNKMQELRNSMRAERDTAREAQRQEMEKFYNSPNFDAKEAQKLAEKHRNDRDVQRMKNRHAMTQILTPEQRTQYRNNMGNKRGYHMNGGNHMRGDGHMNMNGGNHMRGNGRMHNNNW